MVLSGKVFNRQGFVPAGMILHYLPAKNSWEYAEGDRRMDMFVCARMFCETEDKVIYVPEKHKEFIADRYRKLNITCDCRTSAESEVSGMNDNLYSVNYDQNLKMAEFIIDHVSKGFDADLDSTISDFKLNKMEVVKVYLNMSDPSAIEAYEILEGMGFYFSGILPGCDSGEYLMMGQLKGIPMEWDRITLVDGYTDILEYIKKQVK